MGVRLNFKIIKINKINFYHIFKLTHFGKFNFLSVYLETQLAFDKFVARKE